MKIWIMNATSESSDSYPACGVWAHEPTPEEIAEVLVHLDCEEVESEQDAEENGPANPIHHKGKWYANYCYHRIEEREVT